MLKFLSILKEYEVDMSDDVITVCDNCLTASCWLGEFYCEQYKTAGTVEKTVAELKELNLEHSDYWKSGHFMYM